ncbi:hypothetical protein C8R45DRAFT_931500 [Mycena sanguinolenta]|nr:hypothetical protein C8R45DRAFT_931500 [Mycena sanguinolenta]
MNAPSALLQREQSNAWYLRSSFQRCKDWIETLSFDDVIHIRHLRRSSSSMLKSCGVADRVAEPVRKKNTPTSFIPYQRRRTSCTDAETSTGLARCAGNGKPNCTYAAHPDGTTAHQREHGTSHCAQHSCQLRPPAAPRTDPPKKKVGKVATVQSSQTGPHIEGGSHTAPGQVTVIMTIHIRGSLSPLADSLGGALVHNGLRAKTRDHGNAGRGLAPRAHGDARLRSRPRGSILYPSSHLRSLHPSEQRKEGSLLGVLPDDKIKINCGAGTSRTDGRASAVTSTTGRRGHGLGRVFASATPPPTTTLRPRAPTPYFFAAAVPSVSCRSIESNRVHAQLTESSKARRLRGAKRLQNGEQHRSTDPVAMTSRPPSSAPWSCIGSRLGSRGAIRALAQPRAVLHCHIKSGAAFDKEGVRSLGASSSTWGMIWPTWMLGPPGGTNDERWKAWAQEGRKLAQRYWGEAPDGGSRF